MTTINEKMTYQQKIGTAYEYYVLHHIKNDFDKVWHWKKFPEKLMHANKLINDYQTFSKYRNDIGADLVAIKDDKYYFIQCKNYSGTIMMDSLAGFYHLLYEYDLAGILYYNGTLSQRVKDMSNKKVQLINLPFNNETIFNTNNSQDQTQLIITPRDYQLEAYELLKNKSRSAAILPCG